MTAIRCIKPNPNDTQLQFAKAALLDEAFFSGGRCLDGLNRYAYCQDNPVKYTDPTGHMIEADVDDNGHPIICTPDGRIVDTGTGEVLDQINVTYNSSPPVEEQSEPERQNSSAGIPAGTRLERGENSKPPWDRPHAKDYEWNTDSDGVTYFNKKKNQGHGRTEDELTPEEKRIIEDMEKKGEKSRWIPAPAPEPKGEGQKQGETKIGDAYRIAYSQPSPEVYDLMLKAGLVIGVINLFYGGGGRIVGFQYAPY